ncbi:GIY-YIG nuclease family protein [Rhizobiales bacterium]|uniref:GIY-YIG nuclease family protein n=1 Tax=Hongsoonwoonella zoysiae TaxID=2821844 RepID=UPI00155FE15C|nr:GIY-YIG nuclease family protein [Hongsoonwoonella zoysiae]NRG16846.1 GIY-YIG nuclease family protein [Hongsoonwoonella zoysiae]
MPFYIYILASRMRGTLYIGVTNDLGRRVFEHRSGTGSEFTRKHGATKLVYYERYERIDEAIAQEKRLKRWARSWKIQIIESFNPNWDDLYETLNL